MNVLKKTLKQFDLLEFGNQIWKSKVCKEIKYLAYLIVSIIVISVNQKFVKPLGANITGASQRHETKHKNNINFVFAELPETYEVSKEQFKFYNDNGFLVIKQLIDFGSLYSFKKRFNQICNGVVPRGFITIVKERALMKDTTKPEDYVNKLQDILFDDIFATYIENPRLLNVVSQFLGEDITAMHTMLINKPPGTGRHPPHQDLYYFPFRPADKIIAAWTAIDDVTIENGCLYVVPGSHREGELYEHGYPEKFNRMYHGIMAEDTVAPEDKRVSLEMSPGDTVFFHPNLVHGSRPNVSTGYRKSISCHYASSDVHFIDTTGTVQQRIAEEVVAEGRRRGVELTYEDIWRYRSKQVKGTKSILSKL